MERRLKEKLSEYYEAPRPQRKQVFIRRFGVQKVNMLYLIFMQARYISKWAWIFAGVFLGITYIIACHTELKYVNMIYALIPFLVMVSVTESMRSYRYGMEELELSARFSLKSIVMARMLMLGIGNLAVLAGAMLVLGDRAEMNMLHVMTPYFLTASGGLYIVRKIRGSENTFFCFTIAAVVSVLEMLLPWQFGEIFLLKYTPVWVLACVISVAVTVRETYRTIRMTEDLAWN